MAQKLEAHDKLIRIFEGSYQLEIPNYQRPYAWVLRKLRAKESRTGRLQDARRPLHGHADRRRTPRGVAQAGNENAQPIEVGR